MPYATSTAIREQYSSIQQFNFHDMIELLILSFLSMEKIKKPILNRVTRLSWMAQFEPVQRVIEILFQSAIIVHAEDRWKKKSTD